MASLSKMRIVFSIVFTTLKAQPFPILFFEPIIETKIFINQKTPHYIKEYKFYAKDRFLQDFTFFNRNLFIFI
jgi:hypothetical protein